MADMSKINFNIDGVNNEYDIKDKVARNDIAINRTTLGIQCKNLLNHTAKTETINGIQITVNSDNSITIVGTPTTSFYHHLYNNANGTKKTIKKGKYIVSGGSETLGLFVKYGIDITTDSGVNNTQKSVGISDVPITIKNETEFIGFFLSLSSNKEYNTTIYPMLRNADITDNTYEPYKPSLQEQIDTNKTDILSAEKAIEINRATLGTQVTKNILKLVDIIKPTNGLTVTVNSDKSITINGTSTNYNAITLMRGLNLSPDKRYTMSISDIATGMYVFIGDAKQENTYQHTATTITITPKVETNNVWLYCEPATKFNNVTLYPMIHSADITDSNYEPYISPLQEQTDTNKTNIAINRATLGTQSKNLASSILEPQTTNGITVTVNDDKSITFNGKAEETIYFKVGYFTPPDIRTYALSGCPSGGGNTTYQLYIEEVPAYNSGGLTYDKKFTPVSTDRLIVRIAIYKNAELDNVTFYPMIRDADISDKTYEPYKPSLQEQINSNQNDVLNLRNDAFGIPAGRVISNSNLDTFITAGSYLCLSSVVAATLINCPTQSSFRLEVKSLAAGVDRYLQTIYPNEKSNVYCWFRRLTVNGWTSWGVVTDCSIYALKEIVDLLHGATSYIATISGTFTSNGPTTSETTTTRIRTDVIVVKAGDVIKITNGSLYHMCGIWKDSISTANNIRNDTSTITTDETFRIENDGYIIIAFRNKENTTLSPSEFDGSITLYQNTTYRELTAAVQEGANSI